MAISGYLSCPIIREARPDDAEYIARLQINTDSEKIAGVFKDNEKGAFEVISQQFKKHYQGVYVLTEGETLIGAMKLHLPGKKGGNTLSLRSLIKILGIKKGIRAMLLLSNWDEYKLHRGESYLEFIYVDPEWQNCGGGKMLLRRATELATLSGAKYLTLFTAKYNFKARNLYERVGFITRRKIRSPIAKLLRTNSVWMKQTYTLIDGPITVKEYVQDKLQIAKGKWESRREEVIAATKLTLALTIVPIVGGTLAYVRGYPLAVLFWIIIGVLHLLGAFLMLHDSAIGRISIIAAMIPEVINIMNRSVNASSWFDRSWLLPLALINLWILVVVVSFSDKISVQNKTATIEKHRS
ncbi:MAG: GNAT family N-acetyltransferase [Candidatus Heimdallarchaeota archaeon]|nr:GNAT family N-acetyltransferase [Candidatus Heimdallarchaeota archaeon]